MGKNEKDRSNNIEKQGKADSEGGGGDNKIKKIYDLEQRTAVFGERIIDFLKTLPDNVVNRELIRQLVKAGTSVGANYNEADGAELKKGFQA